MQLLGNVQICFGALVVEIAEHGHQLVLRLAQILAQFLLVDFQIALAIAKLIDVINEMINIMNLNNQNCATNKCSHKFAGFAK